MIITFKKIIFSLLFNSSLFLMLFIGLTKSILALVSLIYSLGIRHIGLENAKILSKHFRSFSKFKSLSKDNSYEELLNIDGIG